MAPSDNVAHSFLYVADRRPVLVFTDGGDAAEFQKIFKGAEIYHNKLHVFLPTPYGLESVHATQSGQTAYVFHTSHQAQHWFEQLNGYGTMYTEGEAPQRTVFLGGEGHGMGGSPIWPGVA